MAGIRPGGRSRRWVVLASLAVVTSAAACGTTASGGNTTLPIHESSTTSGSNSATTTTTIKQPVVSTPPSTGEASLASCTMPLTHNAYDGFHIAVPTSWDVASLNGTVEVENDTSATEAVVVIPALETGGLTPTSFFENVNPGAWRNRLERGSTNNVTKARAPVGHPTNRSQPVSME